MQVAVLDFSIASTSFTFCTKLDLIQGGGPALAVVKTMAVTCLLCSIVGMGCFLGPLYMLKAMLLGMQDGATTVHVMVGSSLRW